MNRSRITFSIVLLLLSCTIPSVAQNQFQRATAIAAASGYSITPLLGDYDGDGDMDILGTGHFTQGSTTGKATVLLRNDNGEFVVVDTPQLPWFYWGGMFQWADLDNDNDLDIVAGGCTDYCYNSKMLSIYRNDGADRFTLITAPTNLIGGRAFTLVDYDRDGMVDIEIATQSDNDDSVIGHLFYKNTGNFAFQKTFELPVTTGELTWGDLNNDGWQDFVLYDHTYQNLRNGTFQVFPQAVTMQRSIRHFIFDTDHDGDNDVVTSSGILMKNDGSGQLSYGPIFIPYDINSLLVADFDGDGDLDMVVSGGTSTESKMQLFRSTGGQTYIAEDLNNEYKSSWANQLTLADIDNDKDPDILLSGVFLNDIIILENGLTTKLSNPGAPVNLQSSPTAGTITLSWGAATDPEQSPLRYNVYLLHGDNFKIAPNADLTTGDSFITGVANAGSALQMPLSTSSLPEGYFRWSVQAVDGELNPSRFAPPQEFTLYKNAPANAPTGLSHTLTGLSVSLKWTDNASHETGFTIERSSQNGNTGFEAIKQLPSNTIAYTDNTVSPRSVYYYRIRLDGTADVAYSNVIRVQATATLGSTPSNVKATALSSAAAKIDWQFSGTTITGFVVERSPDNKKNFEAVGSVNASQLTYTDQQLESGRTYYYRVYAANGEEVSDYSDIVNLYVPLKEFNKVTLPSLNYEPAYTMGGIAWGDYDNDGDDDLFLGYKAQLFRNEGNGTFSQIAETGVATSESDRDAVSVWGDYNNDGFLDLFYYSYGKRSSVYRGHGDGTFTKIVTIIDGDRSEITNATWVDYDLDGDLDLSMTGGRYLYRYDGNDTFVRVDLPGGFPSSYYNSSVASWGDYDDDGDPDLFLGNYGKDEFFRNDGNGSFTAVTDQRVTTDYNYDCCPIATHTALWTDFNNDRQLDLTVLHAGAPFYVYANHAGRLDSAFYYYEYSWEYWKNMFWTDYDSDGDLDLFGMGQYNGKTNIWENKENQPFSRLKGGPLYDYVSSDANFAWNDFNNDGYSDLFQFDSNHQVHQNVSNGNSWIKIRLKGRDSNSAGLGAAVLIKSNGHWQRSDVTTHHSYRVQQGFMSLFGLGKATRVDSIQVRWPSGNRQYLTNTNVNQIIVIDENDAQEKVIQAPSNLTAEVAYPSSITLHWSDRSNNETGFVIEMMNAEGQFVEAGTAGADVTSFKLDGLFIGVKYKFRVSAMPNPNDRWTNIVETQIRLFKEVYAGDLTIAQTKPEGVAWGDPDNDGDPDLFVGSESFEPNAVYYNENGVFTRKYLGETSSYARQAQWIDYNNDGFQDLHVSVGGNIIAMPEILNDVLYKNDGTGQLVQQPGHVLATDGYPDFTAAWGDLNHDGHLDVIIPRRSPSLFLNEGDNMVPQESGLRFQDGGMAVLSDLDNDRDLDLMATSFYDYRNLFQNDNGQFNERTDSGISGSLGSFVLEDFNNDGFQDLLVIDQTLRLFLYDPFSKKYSEKSNIFPQLAGGISKISAGDFDNNGFLDVFATGQASFTSNPNRIYLNQGELKFTSLTDTILDRSLFGTALADVNKDGRLDVLTLAGDDYYNTRRYLLQGAQTGNHWLRVKLKGVGTNKFGIGAKIWLFTQEASQVREIRSGSGGTFSDEQTAHFGLGSTTSIEYIKIEWPSGEDQWIANPNIDTELTVEQKNTDAPPAPASPSHLVATVRDPLYIDLQWTDNSDNAKMFRIERAMEAGPFEPIAIVPASTTSYTDSTFAHTAQRSLNLKYRVIAISYITVESAPSNVASALLVTGMERDEENLAIYPQPASSHVFVRSPRLIQHVTITGVRGEIVTDSSFDRSHEVEVPLQGLAPGVYLMAITDETQTRVRKILITPGH